MSFFWYWFWSTTPSQCIAMYLFLVVVPQELDKVGRTRGQVGPHLQTSHCSSQFGIKTPDGMIRSKFFGHEDPVGKISTFYRLEWWRSTWTSCSQCKSIFIVSKFDWLFEFVRSRPNWSASKTSRLFTWLIPSSFLKNGSLSLCHKKKVA